MSAASETLGRLLVGVALVVTCLAAPAGEARARPAEGPPWLKLDRVEAEPTWIDGIVRLRAYVSAILLEGGTIDIHGNKEWVVQLGSSKVKEPYIAGRFAKVDDDLAIAIVVCITTGFSEELPEIKSALTELVEGLPKQTQVAVLGYGEDVEGDRRVRDKKYALESIADLEPELVPTEPKLIKAVQKAVRAFRKVEPSEPGRSVRKLIFVIGDGQDVDHSAQRFRSAARRADREEIRIHTLAYSREDRRQPMLGLAELSKQTHGTFRLARTAQSFDAKIKQLAEEIRQQYVITWYLPADEVEGKRIKLIARDMTSNQVKLKKITCGEETCDSGEYCAAGSCVSRREPEGSGLLGWILMIGGGLVGLLAVLVGVGWFLTRREEKKQAAAALYAAVVEGEQQQAAAQQADGRIVPQGPQGGAVQPTAPRGQPAPAAPPPSGRVQPQGVGRQTGAAAPTAQPGSPGFLYVVKGDRQGQSLPIHHGFRIGKAPNCDLVLASDSFASTFHAHIVVDKGGNATLVDDNSTNGTFVNGVRATAPQRLMHGMLIRCGQTELRFMQG